MKTPDTFICIIFILISIIIYISSFWLLKDNTCYLTTDGLIYYNKTLSTSQNNSLTSCNLVVKFSLSPQTAIPTSTTTITFQPTIVPGYNGPLGYNPSDGYYYKQFKASIPDRTSSIKVY